jgi:hypothetical protein
VDAVALSREYDANEVSADQQFKGKALVVRAMIMAISKDAFGEPYLSLKGHDAASPVLARFSKSDIPVLASLKKQQRVILTCRGGGRVMTSSVLQSCGIVDESWKLEVANTLFDGFKARIGSDAKPSDEEIGFAAVVIATASLMKDASACLAEAKMAPSCLHEAERIQQNKDGRLKMAMEDAIKRMAASGTSWAKAGRHGQASE